MVHSTEIDKLIFRSLAFINENKNDEAHHTILSILNNNTQIEKLNTNHWEFIAGISLAVNDLEFAKRAFNKSNNKPGASFVLVLQNKIQEASLVLKDTNKSPASIWCNFLIDLFSKKLFIREWPSFLIVRHFLEFTVYNLLYTKNHEYLDILLKKLSKLTDINLDSEKLVGCAYYHYGDLERSIMFLNNAVKRNQFDGEIFFVLGQVYRTKNMLYDSLAMLENAKLLLPKHSPSEELYEKVRSLISGKQEQ